MNSRCGSIRSVDDSWTDGPVAGPIIYSETILPATSDLSMGGAKFATKNENNSAGFNLGWDVTDSFGLEFDFHNSTAESGSDSPYGSNAVLGVAGFYRGTTTVDWSKDFPVLSVALPAGQAGIDASQMMVTGSSFRNSYMKMEIQQAQLNGHFEFSENSKLNFGVATTEVDNRSAFSNVQADTWGGATNAGDYPDDVWKPDTVRHYFDNISGSSNPNLFNQFFTWDFETVRRLAADALNEQTYRVGRLHLDRRRTAIGAHLRAVQPYRAAMPLPPSACATKDGVPEAVPTATGINWVANNEFSWYFRVPTSPRSTASTTTYCPARISRWMTRQHEGPFVVRREHRPARLGDIRGGQTLNQLARINGGTGRGTGLVAARIAKL
jgi:hypothetical protein